MSKTIDVPTTTKPYIGSDLIFCQNCIMPSTRPRIEFDARGFCNACVWAEEKRDSVDWDGRWGKLEELCDHYRKEDGFDVLVGVSGGKDGSYVSHMLKHRLGMHPLCITVTVPLALQVGNENLRRFIESGYDHVQVTPNPRIMRSLNKIGLLEQGRPLYGWQIPLQVALLRTSIAFNIPFIMYGEDGEVEYGGSTESKNRWSYSPSYAKRVYLSGEEPHDKIAKLSGDLTAADFTWWRFPGDDEFENKEPKASHWSYFENWDPYDHYLVAKEKCGLVEREDNSSGTYTNFAQTDTCLFDLHMYFAFLKFGFGRCTQDVGIDIRRGAMDRKQGIELAKVYDWEPPPENFIQQYLEYYELDRTQFNGILDTYANKALLRKDSDGFWKPNFIVS
jgi:N-acetyl sugar amidotransferase